MRSLFLAIQRLFGSFHFDATPLLLLAPRLLCHAEPIHTPLHFAPAVRSSSELGWFFADRGSACACRCLALPPQIFSAYRAGACLKRQLVVVHLGEPAVVVMRLLRVVCPAASLADCFGIAALRFSRRRAETVCAAVMALRRQKLYLVGDDIPCRALGAVLCVVLPRLDASPSRLLFRPLARYLPHKSPSCRHATMCR